MKVISKKSTKRLVKGGEYEVVSLWNDGTSNIYREGQLEIKGIGLFKVNAFTTIDGSEIPQSKKDTPLVEFSDLKKGDILVAKFSNKSLIKGNLYVISETKIVKKRKMMYNKRIMDYDNNVVKFEGFSSWVTYSRYRFELASGSVVRDISINEILGTKSKGRSVVRKSYKRSFDGLDSGNKNRVLFESICAAATDKYRNNLNVLDWAIDKSGSNYGICKKDFDKILELSLGDVIKLIDKLK